MPRPYSVCRAGQQRYEVSGQVMGRAIQMCRALATDDTEAKPGRRTRCFDPAKDGSKRKTCQILVDHEFATIVPPSLYLPSELQRRGIRYECGNENPILMTAFDGQGDNFSVEYSCDHLIVGPLHDNDEWKVFCTDAEALIPHGARVIFGDTFDANVTRRAMHILRFIPNAGECQRIVARWDEEVKWVCQAQQRNLFAASATIRGLHEHGYCADDLYDTVNAIVEHINTTAEGKAFQRLCKSLFLMGMYQRRWQGPGKPFPIEEADTHINVTAANVSAELIGTLDDETGAPLDHIGTHSDGAAGVLVNCVRKHGRRAMELLEDMSWLHSDDAAEALGHLTPASLHVRALEPRGSIPTRFVHSLLPMPGSRLIELVRNCLEGRECVRMGSAKLVLTAFMLHFAHGKTIRNPAWRAQTHAQGDIIPLLDKLSNII